MRLRDPRTWLWLASLGGVGAIAAVEMGRTLPGPLSSAHAAVPELAGGAHCSQCHGGWFSTMQQSCLECHPAIAGQLADHRGLHGAMATDRQQNCGLCHGEHHGPNESSLGRASWALAGVADAATFDHARIGLPFAGRHLELACDRCHTHANEQPLAGGHRRFLGLDRACSSCHEDPHGGAMRVRCDQCHGQSSFRVLASTGHERLLPLTGGHGNLDCARCHAPGTPLDVMALGRRAPPRVRGCTDCHDSPHRAVPVAALARPDAETGDARLACGTCHEAQHTDFAAARATMTAERHAAIGFPLQPPHDAVACKGCHPATGTFAERHPGRAAEQCASCHADPHGGQFATSPLASDGCRSCHQRERFAPNAFTRELHARTALPLDGAHLRTDCNGCHLQPPDGGPRRFAGTPARCDACHPDVHDGAFAALAGQLANARGDLCAGCHDTATFAAAARAFDHGRFTAMALDGAHAVAGCDACHPRSEKADARGRAFGRVRDHRGAFRGCVTCHDDPHGARFDRPGLPAAVDGRRDCARCHGTASFRVLPTPFDHARWTGYALRGKHAETRCSDCHPPGATPATVPGLATDPLPPPRGKQCAECHDEPHAGQFAPAPSASTDCTRCHRAAATFADLVFRHDVDARFALGEAHAKVACSKCHPTEPHGERGVVRYRPVPRECTDCHDQQQDPLRRARGRTTGGSR